MSDFGATMDALAQRFLVRCAEDLPKLQQCRAGSAEERGDLRLIAHRMSGSAGLFGYKEVGALAAQVDEELSANGPTEAPTLPALVDALEALLGVGRASGDACVSENSSGIPSLS